MADGWDWLSLTARIENVHKSNKQGCWKNEYAYHGKTVIDFERQGQPSKWVTLRACRVLRAMGGA